MVLRSITENNRPTIANDALLYCKQLFNHGIKLDIIASNPASAFAVGDADGIEKSRDRALTLKELTFKRVRMRASLKVMSRIYNLA